MNLVGTRLFRIKAGKIGAAPHFWRINNLMFKICDNCLLNPNIVVEEFPRQYDFVNAEEQLAPFTTGIGIPLAFKEVAIDLAARFPGLDLASIVAAKGTPKKFLRHFERYYQLIPSVRLPMSIDVIHFGKEESCPNCGRTSVQPTGVELGPREEKIGDRWEMVPRTLREPGKGYMVPHWLMMDQHFLQCGYYLCTEDVAKYVSSLNLKYIELLEYGEIV